MSFKCGDKVYLPDFEATGVITETYPGTDLARVKFVTYGGGGNLLFKFHEMMCINDVDETPTMEVFKSVHGTVHVVVQNCNTHINDILSLFDVWKSGGNYKYDDCKPYEKAKIWFECPMEFLDFIESSMGKAAFQRLGVDKIEVRH